MGSKKADIWAQIDRSESYLVSSMYEEAASLAFSILKQLSIEMEKTEAQHNNHDDQDEDEDEDDVNFYDMLESTGMVLLQSLHHLNRTSEILDLLKQSFPSAPAIPVRLLVTGVCFLIPEISSGVREFVEEFLSKWRFVDEKCYVLANVSNVERYDRRSVLGVEEYLDVVEVYVMKLLGTTPNDESLAISWVEKAELPEDKRQGLLRRLHSLHSVKAMNSSKESSSPFLADNHKVHSNNVEKLNMSEGSPEMLDNRNYPLDEDKIRKQVVLRLPKRMEPCFWWFRTIKLKFGNACVVISNGKIALSFMIMLVCWILRRKRASLKGIVQKQALFVKKAVVDLWQLAFSYQVNPLAAVQSSPAPLRGSQR